MILFNNIYREIREERSLIDLHWLKLLHSFIISLTYIEKDISEDYWLKQIDDALEHIVRVLIVKPDFFKKTSKTRVAPDDFQGNTLTNTTQWLFNQTNSSNLHCRNKCFYLFKKIVTSLEESLADFVFNPDNKNFCISKFYSHEIIQRPVIEDLKLDEDLNVLYKWMNNLHSSIDGHIFVIENDIFEPNFIFTTSYFFMALQCFIRSANLTLEEVVKSNILISQKDKEYFDYLKVNVSRSILKFSIILLMKKEKISNENIILHFSTLFFSFFQRYIFTPVLLGFDLNNMNKEQDCILHLLSLIKEKLPFNKTYELSNILNDSINENILLTYYKYVNVPVTQRQILRGVKILAKSSFSDYLKLNQYSGDIISSIISELLDVKESVNYFKTINETVFDYNNTKLELAMEYFEDADKIMNFIFDTRKNSEDKFFGLYVFDMFKNIFVKYLVKNFETFFQNIQKKELNKQYFHIIVEIITEFERTQKNRTNDMPLENIRKVIKDIIFNWEYFSFSDNQILTVYDGLRLAKKLTDVDFKIVNEYTKCSESFNGWMLNLYLYSEVNWSKKNYLNFFEQLIDVLPCIIGPEDDESANLRYGNFFSILN